MGVFGRRPGTEEVVCMSEGREGRNLKRREAMKKWKAVLAVFLSVVLVLQSSNIQALADVIVGDGESGREEIVLDKPAEETEPSELTDEQKDTPPASEPKKAEEPAEPTEPATPEEPAEQKDEPAEETKPAEKVEETKPAETTEPSKETSNSTADEQSSPETEDTTATLKFDVTGATLTYNQDGEKNVTADTADKTAKVETTQDFKFTVTPDDGQQIASVKAVTSDGAESDVVANDSGEYTLAAANVTDGTTIKVTTEAVPEPETPAEEETTETDTTVTDDTTVEDEETTPEVTLNSVASASNSVMVMANSGGNGTQGKPYLLTIDEDSQTITATYHRNWEWYIQKVGGYSWTPVQEGSSRPLQGVSATNVSNGWSIGIYTEDASVTISFTDSADTNAVYRVVYARDTNRISGGTYLRPIENNTWTVAFNANGGNGAPQAVVVEKGEQATIPSSTPTRNGYKFMGWSTSRNAQSAQYQAGAQFTPSDNVTLYAVWKQAFTVTFDPNGGSGRTQTREYTETSFTTPDPNELGFSNGDATFVGWSTSKDGNGDVYTVNTTYPDNPSHNAELTGNVTLYAIWFDGESSHGDLLTAYFYIRVDGQKPFEPSGYNSGYLPANNGTQLQGKLKQPVAINNNSELVAANLAEKPSDAEIQQQIETYNRQNGTNLKYDPATMHIEWYVIKARNNDYGQVGWNVDGIIVPNESHQVAYHPNGGNANVPMEKSYSEGATVQVDFSATPSRAGYTFLGWDTDKNATNPRYPYTQSGSNNYRFTMGDSDVTLYAIWQEKDAVTVYYKAVGGGTVSPESESLRPDTGVAKGSTAKANTGYKFDGWYDNESCEGEKLSSSEEFIPTKAEGEVWQNGTTYYAKFVRDDSQQKKITYTVRHEVEGVERHKTVFSQMVWAGEENPTIEIKQGALDQETYKGYRYDHMSPEKKVGDFVENGTIITLYYVKDETQTQPTEYTVQHVVAGEVRDTKTYKSTAWINDEDPKIVIEEGSLAQKSYTGYKFEGISPNVAEGGEVANGTTITLTYVKDAEQEHTVTATVEYYFGDTIDDAKAKEQADATDATASQTGWVGEDTTVKVTPNTTDKFVGYKFAEMDPDKTEFTIAAGTEGTQDNTVKVYYVKDAEQEHTVTATVEYYFGDTIDDAKAKEQADATDATASQTGWVGEDTTVKVTPNTTDKFVGYKFAEMDPDKTEFTIAAGTEGTQDNTVKVYYVKDAEQVQNTKYTVRHVVGDDVIETEEFASTAWVNDDPAMIVIQDGTLDHNAYTGYKWEKTVVSGTENPVTEGQSIETNTVIDVIYVPDFDADGFAFTVSGATWTYDGTTDVIDVTGILVGDQVTYTWQTESRATQKITCNVVDDGQGNPVIQYEPTFKNVSDSATVLVNLTRSGVNSEQLEATMAVNPTSITVTADNQTKVAGTADPAFTSTYTPAVGSEVPGWDGVITRDPGEAAGTYAITQGTLALADGENGFLASNYVLTFVNGTLTITAAPVTPGGGGDTPAPTPGDGTPTPTPVPTPAPVVAVDTTGDDATDEVAEPEEAIEDDTTPMAGPTETIDDDGTPLADGKHVDCWVHWLILLGMILSAVYFVGVCVRRRKFTSNLLGYEDKVLGNDRDNV